MPSRVLVVDDDPLMCEFICEVLSTAGMDPEFMTSSAAAAVRLNKEKFHAVFLDMCMPSPDGIEVARQIRASRVNASSVIIMVTGEDDRTLMKRAFEAGVDLFLFKPVEPAKLLRIIRAAGNRIERERRRFRRVEVRCRVSMELSNARFEGKTVDLTVGGMLVQSDRVFPVSTLVTVSLELEAGQAPMYSAARVVRNVGTDCMGLQFENLGTEESRRLQAFLLPMILATT